MKKLVTAFLLLLNVAIGAFVEYTAAANQYGKWLIVQSNDPKVKLLTPPVVLVITPGSFEIPGKVKGSFEFEPKISKQNNGVYFSMSPFSLPFMKQTYNIVPLDPNKLALYGTGRHAARYYLLERYRDRDHGGKIGRDGPSSCTPQDEDSHRARV